MQSVLCNLPQAQSVHLHEGSNFYSGRNRTFPFAGDPIGISTEWDAVEWLPSFGRNRYPQNGTQSDNCLCDNSAFVFPKFVFLPLFDIEEMQWKVIQSCVWGAKIERASIEQHFGSLESFLKGLRTFGTTDLGQLFGAEKISAGGLFGAKSFRTVGATQLI